MSRDDQLKNLESIFFEKIMNFLLLSYDVLHLFWNLRISI